MKKVCVVILNWNGGDLTVRCLENLRKSDYADLVWVIVDNGSTDGSLEQIVKLYPDAGVIKNPTNLGFAEGCNQGIAWGLNRGAGYLLMLNNDTRVDPALVSKMVATAEKHRDQAVVIPKIYWETDPSRLWFAIGRANLWTGVFSNSAYNRVDDGSVDSHPEAEYASGCCILMARDIVQKVGGFDRSYFAYVEDVDWSLRCRGAGFPLILCPTAKLWHVVSATGSKRPATYRYLTTRNHLWTMRKHATAYQFAVFTLLFYPLRCLLRLADAVRRAQWACVAAEFRGAFEGFLAPVNQRSSISERPGPAGNP